MNKPSWTVSKIEGVPSGKAVGSWDPRKPGLVAAFKLLTGATKVTSLKERNGKFQASCMKTRYLTTEGRGGYDHLGTFELVPAGPVASEQTTLKKADQLVVGDVVCEADGSMWRVKEVGTAGARSVRIVLAPTYDGGIVRADECEMVLRVEASVRIFFTTNP